jgi:hypothetical protein
MASLTFAGTRRFIAYLSSKSAGNHPVGRVKGDATPSSKLPVGK